MDQVAQQESPMPMHYTNCMPVVAFGQSTAFTCEARLFKANIPCHITTGSDVELKDLSSGLGNGLYNVDSERGKIQANQLSSAKAVTRCQQRRRLQRPASVAVSLASFTSVSSAT